MYLERQILLIGEENQQKISDLRVCIFGIGGVGSYVFESLIRNGVKNILVCDKDVIDETNINRQLLAYIDTIGKPKVDVAYTRAKNISKDITVIPKYVKVDGNISEIISDFNPTYIVDAVDDIQAKLEIVSYAKQNNIKVISSMGAGNRVKPWDVCICDIFKTENCPLAKKFRKELRKNNIDSFDVVYSKEIPIKSSTVTSLMEVVATFGIYIAGYILNDVMYNYKGDKNA